MEISEIAQRVTPSPTRHLYNLAKNYTDTIDLTLGDPDLQPIEPIKQAACDCIHAGKTRYSSNAGLSELRKKISLDINKTYNISSSDENIIVTVGGMEALYLTFLTILNPGDEVIVFAPHYVNYVEMIKMCNAIPVIISTDENNYFEVGREQIEQSISHKTKAIIINNPNNPTGHIYSHAFLNNIFELGKKYGLYIISDEVYKELIYKEKFESIFKEISDNLILIDSFSKKHCMTGWRIGYAAGPEFLISAMTKLQENIAACAPVISQYAAITALDYPMPAVNIAEFKKRRDLLIEAFKDNQKLHLVVPEGAFYAFVNIGKLGMKSLQFCEALLKKYHVAVAPGIAYGAEYDNYIRIAFTLSCDRLKEGINRIKTFAESV